MVNPLTRPAFLYGKTAAKSRVPQDYRVLAEHSRFTAADVRILERIPGGFAWSASRQGKHATCFAYVRLERCDAVLRLLDIGFDDQGRPHCLRMEVARLDEAAGPTDERTIAALLTAAAWPESPIEITAEPVVDFRATEPDVTVVELLTARRRDGRNGSVLIGEATSFTNATFETVLDSTSGRSTSGDSRPAARSPATFAVASATPAYGEQRAEPSSAAMRGEAAAPRGRGFVQGLLLGVVLIGFGAGVPAALYYHTQQDRLADVERMLRDRESERVTLAERLRKVDSEKKELTTELEAMQMTTASQERAIAAWKTAAEGIGVVAPGELEKQIKVLRTDAGESVRQENARVRKKLDAVRRALDE